MPTKKGTSKPSISGKIGRMLRGRFPNVNFTVRKKTTNLSETYTITWEDGIEKGATVKAVNSIIVDSFSDESSSQASSCVGAGFRLNHVVKDERRKKQVKEKIERRWGVTYVNDNDFRDSSGNLHIHASEGYHNWLHNGMPEELTTQSYKATSV